MSEEQKPQSENPFEYGDKYFKRLSGDAKETTEQVIAVVGDLVCFGNGPHSWEWMHYKRLQETLAIEKWEKIYPRKWKDLTAENWRERRDMAVWCRDLIEIVGPFKLIDFIAKKQYPFIVLNHNKHPVIFKRASIYNDDGEEARLEDQ